MGHCGENGSTGTTWYRPSNPDAAPHCPVPPEAESPCLFRGDGRGYNPDFGLEDEEVEAWVIWATAFCEIRCSMALSDSAKAAVKLLGRACYCCSQTAAALLWTYAVTSAEIPSRLFVTEALRHR